VTACGACNLKKGRMRLAHYLAQNPDAHRNFQQYAIHVWKRHLAAIEEEVTKEVRSQKAEVRRQKAEGRSQRR
jgi:hypothetical protein